MSFDIVDRPGCITKAAMRALFEGAITQTPGFARNTPLGIIEVNGEFARFANADTDTMWLGFAIGMRCAERVQLHAMTAAERVVLDERHRQVDAEGWTPHHDDEHDPGELAAAAASYALAAADVLHPLSQGDGDFQSHPPAAWPWAPEWWKPGTDPARMLAKALALGLAQIEQIARAAARDENSAR